MSRGRYNEILDKVYQEYLETHQYEPLIIQEEMNLSKEEFVNRATNNHEFGQLFGINLTSSELTWQEQVQWVMKYTDVELENLYIVEEVAKPTTPTKLITLVHENEKLIIYA